MAEPAPTFNVTDVAQFSHPTDEMPAGVRAMLAAGASVVYRYATDDDRVAWVPVTPADLHAGDDVEAFVEKLALKALADLDS